MGGSQAVAVLLTDMVSSTPLAVAAGDRFAELLLRHRELLASAVAGRGGTLSAREGDGCLALFPSVADAIDAAVDGQRALSREPWPAGLVVRVRMAVHHGRVVLVDDEPVGLVLHHTARMLAVAGAGQVVVSGDAADRSPVATLRRSLVDGGTHRLRDFVRPVRLFQVAAEGLTVTEALSAPGGADGPAAAGHDQLIGRGREVEAVSSALARARLVTITGAGGSGKTRLATAVAQRWGEAAGGPGTYWVDLAGLADASLVPETVVAALGVEARALAALPALREALVGRSVLIVLDNCEHVVAGLGPLLDVLDRDCPDVTVLATSRAGLGTSGEVEWPLAPLPVPAEVADLARLDPVEIDALAAVPSVALFVARASALRPGFRLTGENAGVVARACRQLDGLPLAIELAAARLRVLDVRRLGDRLGDLDVLRGGPARPPRHRTMRATIDWSHDLLDDDEKAAFRRLAAFAGGFRLAAAEAVLGTFGTTSAAAADLVERLLANGMLTASDDGDGDGDGLRFRLLEPLRGYAWERLDAAGEADAAGRAHAAWAIDFAGSIRTGFLTDQAASLVRCEEERANVQVAILGAVERDDGTTALRIVASLGTVWFMTSQPDARPLADRALTLAAGVDDRLHGWALVTTGLLSWDASDFPAALRLFSEALRLFEASGSRSGRATALLWLARLPRPDTRAERQLQAEEALRLFRAAGVASGVGWSLTFLANAKIRGDTAGARRHAEEAYAVARDAGFTQLLADAQRLLGMVSWVEGDLDEARSRYEQALDVHLAGRDRWQATTVLGEVGYLCAASGDVDAALGHFQHGLRLLADLGSADRLGVLLRGLVPVLWRLGRRRDAATLLGACEVRSPEGIADAYSDALRMVEEGIDGPDLEAAQVAGRQLTHHEATALAARTVDDARRRHRA